MKKIAITTMLCLSCIAIQAQTSELSAEGRKSWNKALLYIEQAQTESEWQLAVDALESVKKSDPGYNEIYLKLGDAYSKINTEDALTEAKSNYRKYMKLMPSLSMEIQDKIDRLEAQYEINEKRKREEFFKSLVGKWSMDDSNDMWTHMFDFELFNYNGKIRIKYFSSFDLGDEHGNNLTITKLKYMDYNDDSKIISCAYNIYYLGHHEDDDYASHDIYLQIPFQQDVNRTLNISIKMETYETYYNQRKFLYSETKHYVVYRKD